MMSLFKSPLSISSISGLVIISIFSLDLFSFTHAATFGIRNNCPYTVWAAASPGGGKQLNSGGTWTISVAPGTTMGRVWARTNCNFDGSGRGSCQTGDCGGLLVCQGYGAAPNTLAEYAIKQYAGLDYWDISLIAGFNVPMEFSGCNIDLRCGGPGCPDAYPKQPTCPGNSNYNVVFCP